VQRISIGDAELVAQNGGILPKVVGPGHRLWCNGPERRERALGCGTTYLRLTNDSSASQRSCAQAPLLRMESRG
jgi:hypothetical protein